MINWSCHVNSRWFHWFSWKPCCPLPGNLSRLSRHSVFSCRINAASVPPRLPPLRLWHMWSCLCLPSQWLPRGVGCISPVPIQCQSLFHKVPGCTWLTLLWRFGGWHSDAKDVVWWSCSLLVNFYTRELQSRSIHDDFGYSGLLIRFNWRSVLLPPGYYSLLEITQIQSV